MLKYWIESLSLGRWLVGITKRKFLLGFIFVLRLPVVASATRVDCAGSTAGATSDVSLFSDPARGDAYRDAVLGVMEEFHIPGIVAGVWVPGKKPWKIAAATTKDEGSVADGRFSAAC